MESVGYTYQADIKLAFIVRNWMEGVLQARDNASTETTKISHNSAPNIM